MPFLSNLFKHFQAKKIRKKMLKNTTPEYLDFLQKRAALNSAIEQDKRTQKELQDLEIRKHQGRITKEAYETQKNLIWSKRKTQKN